MKAVHTSRSRQYISHIYTLSALCIGMLLLSGCGRPEAKGAELSKSIDPKVVQEEKITDDKERSEKSIKKLYVDVSPVSDLSGVASLSKTGKIEGKTDITVSAQANGRISKISSKEGALLAKGNTVITLTDTYGNLSFTTQKAKESLDSAKLTYASNKVSLENTLIDLKHNVKKAQQAVDTSYTDITQQEKDETLQRLDFEQQRLDAQQQLEDAQQQLADFEQQLADSEQQLKDNEEQLKDSEQQLKDSEQLIKDSEKQRLQNTYSATTNDPNGTIGSAKLQLDKFDSDIQKTEFDYGTKLEADAQMLEGFLASSDILKNNVFSTYRTVIDEADKILGVTSLNQYSNAGYQQYLGALNTQTKRDAQDELRRLISQQVTLDQLAFDTQDVEMLSTNLGTLTETLDTLDTLLRKIDTMLLNSVSASAFPQTKLDGLKSLVDGLEAQIQGQDANITQQVNQINAFLRTYKQNQDSLLQSISILKEQREVVEQQLRDGSVSAQFGADRADIGSQRSEIAATRSEISGNRTRIAAKRAEIGNLRTQIAKKRSEIGLIRSQIGVERNEISISRAEIGIEKNEITLQNALTTARLNLESAQNGVTAHIKNKDASLKTLQNSIDQARVSYNETVANVDKLVSRAPVSGTIGSILVDLGQEVTVGTVLYSLSDTRLQEVIIYLSSTEKDSVTIGEIVSVTAGENTYSGRINSISDIADDQLLYKATIYLDVIRDRLGDVVTVKIPLAGSKLLLPLNIITMSGENAGTVRAWNGQGAEKRKVTTGPIRGDMIEILSGLSESSEIITSSMSTYDPATQIVSRRPE